MSLLAVNEQAEAVACVQLIDGIAVMASVSRRPTPQPLNRRYGTGRQRNACRYERWLVDTTSALCARCGVFIAETWPASGTTRRLTG
jgi:hypothetical protein